MHRLTKLVLIRHGQSTRNAIKGSNIFFPHEGSRSLVEGIGDHETPLSAIGFEQALETGAGLYENFDMPSNIFNSGYLRTVQTMDCILSRYPGEVSKLINIQSNMLIREREAGYTYDMTEAEAETAFPWLQEYWITTGSFYARPPGGESVADVVLRVGMFLDSICNGGTIFVVTHAATIKAFRYLLEGRDSESLPNLDDFALPRNCGVTSYEYDSSMSRLVLNELDKIYWS